jgi:competence protein ComEA
MDGLQSRLHELAKRAGLGGLPPGVLIACLSIAAVAAVYALWQFWPHFGSSGAVLPSTGKSASEKPAAASSATKTGDAGASGAGAPVQPSENGTAGAYVHVVGAVRHPGLYRVASGARVADAIAQAGGLLGSASQAAVNLARQVSDGEQIVVPTQDEVAGGGAAGASASGPGAATSPGGSAGASAGVRVNINTADAVALDSLPGVGPSTAAKIVAEREQNGPFASPDDLARVTGIGPKKLEALRDLVVTQ